jgi:hypothetical protein
MASTGRSIKVQKRLVAIFQSRKLSQSMRLPSAVRFSTAHMRGLLEDATHPNPNPNPNKILSSPKGRPGRHLYHAVHLLLRISL